ncbi:AMIN-like domain-containing (lipo)protein [Chondromyces crocatus]|uniref:AMIN-like domain-containing protein n=1 Tax=Chondromyces crocatus TaxID=52 RepID=A0A0K1E7P6_CHOCO|nr:hypothetical protein [Chondromyces crocatus]AKT36578.1 uncharacterized protein CMC5_006960 [Chondromyces crocatus]
MKERWVTATMMACVLAGCSNNAGNGSAPVPDVTPIDTRPVEATPTADAVPPVPQPSPKARPAAEETTDEAPAFEGTTAPSEKLRTGIKATPVVKDVRAAANEGFDRVVLDLEGQAVTGWKARYLTGPAVRCGSGDPIKSDAKALLEITLLPAQAHDDKGNATVKDRERKPGLKVLKELTQVCDFEGQVSWVLGLSEKAPYRVLELSSPSRIVVDVRR